MHADFERLLVPGCTDLPACRCGKEMQIARTFPFPKAPRRISASMIARCVTMNCDLLFGVESRKVEEHEYQPALALIGCGAV